MNMQNLTQKAVEAVNEAVNIAKEYGNPEVCEEHILYALLNDDGGLAVQIFKRMGVDVESLKQGVNELIGRLNKTSGNAGEALSRELNDAFNAAERKSKEMKDEVV